MKAKKQAQGINYEALRLSLVKLKLFCGFFFLFI